MATCRMLLSLLIFLFQLVTCAPKCIEFTVPVSISATNARIPDGLLDNLLDPLSLLNGVVSLVFNLPILGTYDIAARYCEPEVHVEGHQDTVQFLTHGATYDQNYWSGDHPPGESPETERYSWVEAASQRGYATLSYDRLGSGQSEHPDPIAIVQLPAQVEIANELVKRLRAGEIESVGRGFGKVVYVGHSLGSIIGNALTVKYPGAVEGVVLTGFSKKVLTSASGVFLTAGLIPAALIDPLKWPLDLGYLAASNFDGFKKLFWVDGNYDPGFMNKDWQNRGTITLGEGATTPLGVATARKYTGPVLVLTGEKDACFCSNTLGFAIFGPGNCGGNRPSSLLAQTKTLYPAAKYESFALPNTGHVANFHFNAQDGFAYAHDWMERNEF